MTDQGTGLALAGEPTKGRMVMSEQNALVVRQMIDRVLNGRDLAALDEFVAEDFVELDPFPGQGKGREGLREVMAGLIATFPDMQWSVQEQVSEGDKVVTRFTWTGTHSADFGGVPASGRPCRSRALSSIGSGTGYWWTAGCSPTISA